ncbi:unnamed protein product, partial [Prunus brigantina]
GVAGSSLVAGGAGTSAGDRAGSGGRISSSSSLPDSEPLEVSVSASSPRYASAISSVTLSGNGGGSQRKFRFSFLSALNHHLLV